MTVAAVENRMQNYSFHFLFEKVVGFDLTHYKILQLAPAPRRIPSSIPFETQNDQSKRQFSPWGGSLENQSSASLCQDSFWSACLLLGSASEGGLTIERSSSKGWVLSVFQKSLKKGRSGILLNRRRIGIPFPLITIRSGHFLTTGLRQPGHPGRTLIQLPLARFVTVSYGGDTERINAKIYSRLIDALPNVNHLPTFLIVIKRHFPGMPPRCFKKVFRKALDAEGESSKL